MAVVAVTTALVELGAAIGKALLKRWLKDGIALAAGESLISVLSKIPGEYLEKRKSGRLIESVGEEVAVSLEPFFDVEGALVPENDQVAVVNLLKDVIEKAAIDPTLLACLDLNRDKLEDHLLDLSRAEQISHSEGAWQLYTRLVIETSGRIIDIAERLPHFQARTLAELLARESDIRSGVAETLQLLKSKLEEEPQQKATRYRRRYLQNVADKMGRIELLGADISGPARRYDLIKAFVSLRVRRRAPVPISTDPPIRAEQLIDSGSRILIRSRAGAGKTTLMQWLAVRCTDQPDCVRAVPFYIRLRDYARNSPPQLPQPGDFCRLLAEPIECLRPQGWAEARLEEAKGAIVLIDGIDEIGADDRQHIRNWVHGLMLNFPAATYVMTTRSYAVDDDDWSTWLNEHQVVDLDLLPMELEDIRLFIERWYTAVADNIQAEGRPATTTAADRLYRTIMEDVDYCRLATSPLLCALLCFLNHRRQSALPMTRVELYRRSCDMLLTREHEDVDPKEIAPMQMSQRSSLLGELAYQMQLNAQLTPDFERAAQWVRTRFESFPGLSGKTSVEAVLRALVARSGLLVEENGRIEFVNEALREFLAATAIVANGNIGLLITKALVPDWRETMVLTSGHSGARDASDLITGIHEKMLAESSCAREYARTGLYCYSAASALDEKARRCQAAFLETLLPPLDRHDADAIACAPEEIALPRLAYNSIKESVISGVDAHVPICAAITTIERFATRRITIEKEQCATLLGVLETYRVDSNPQVLEALAAATANIKAATRELVQAASTP